MRLGNRTAHHMRCAGRWHVLDVPIDVRVEGRQWQAQAGESVWVSRGATTPAGQQRNQGGAIVGGGVRALSTKVTSTDLKTTTRGRGQRPGGEDVSHSLDRKFFTTA